MLTGTIKFFNKSKGFGFITADAGKEVFLPSATVASSGIKKVEPGIRVSFEEEADVKGPKAVSLTLLDEPRREPAPRPAPVDKPVAAERPAPRPAPAPSAKVVVLYFDPASRALEGVQQTLADQGMDVQAVDYTAQPPTPEELKKWSLALHGSDMALVRRSDPMFYALDLDDRFISENDFWLAVSQHPTLINGPLLRAGGKLAVAKSPDDVRRFLGLDAAAPAPKGLSARLSALIRGEALPPEEEEEDFEDDVEDIEEVEEIEEAEEVAAVEAVAAPVKTAPKKATVKTVKDAAKPAGKAKPAAKPVAKKAVPARKPAAKAKKK